jgi:hypothetical protein
LVPLFAFSCSDASRSSVDRALSNKSRIGLAPGGIKEILQAPEPDKEYAIVGKGIFRLAIKHQVPVIPIYCFGSSMLMKRLPLPAFVEKLSLLLRISFIVFYGKMGLPIPFRQRLLYVMGKPVFPEHQQQISSSTTIVGRTTPTNMDIDMQADDMYKKYCQELIRIFDRHKESYASGWESKSLTILPG